MVWQDILLESLHPDARISHALAKAFAVDREHVRVVDVDDKFPDTRQLAVVCVTSSRPRGFKQLLSLHLFNGAERKARDSEVVNIITATLEDRCITLSKSLNPYTVTLHAPNSASEKRDIDPEGYERDEYIIQ